MSRNRYVLFLAAFLGWMILMVWTGRHGPVFWRLWINPGLSFAGVLWISWRIILAGRSTFTELLRSIPQNFVWSLGLAFCRHKERLAVDWYGPDGIPMRTTLCIHCGRHQEGPIETA